MRALVSEFLPLVDNVGTAEFSSFRSIRLTIAVILSDLGGKEAEVSVPRGIKVECLQCMRIEILQQQQKTAHGAGMFSCQQDSISSHSYEWLRIASSKKASSRRRKWHSTICLHKTAICPTS